MPVDRSQLRKFAEEVVSIYASRVSMTLLAQGELERAVIARIASADPADAGAYPALANEAIAEWERRSATRGPRIVVTAAGRVAEKRATA